MNITRKKNLNTNQINLQNISQIISSDLPLISLYNILISNATLINQKDSKGETFLTYAIKRNKFEVFKLLLTSPILDLNYKDIEGNSYLEIAVIFQRENMIIPLIQKGINVNMKNNDGNTSLHLAYINYNENIIKILVDNNIDCTIKNNKGEIAEDLNEKNDKQDVSNNKNENNNNSNVSLDKPNKKINTYDDDDYVNTGLSLVIPKKEKEKYQNPTKNNNDNNNEIINESNDNEINDEEKESKVKDTFSDDFFELSVDLPKKENKDIVKEITESNDNYNDYNDNDNENYNNSSNIIKKSTTNIDIDFDISDDDETNIKIDESKEINEKKEEKNEDKYDENYNPLNDNEEEDTFKIEKDDEDYNKIRSNKTIKTSEIDFNSISQSYPKTNINISPTSGTERKKNSLSLNFNQPVKIAPKKINDLELDDDNPLYKFLQTIEMEKYFDNLDNIGFDDVKLLIEQTKNGIGISDDNLKKCGIKLPGDRAKILIKIQEEANNFNFKIPKEVYYNCRNLNNYKNDVNIIKLNDWLKEIKLEEYLLNFINSGYYSKELLVFQMISKQPINNDILENEIGIKKLGHRERIMNKLIEEGKKLGSKFNFDFNFEFINDIFNKIDIKKNVEDINKKVGQIKEDCIIF